MERFINRIGYLNLVVLVFSSLGIFWVCSMFTLGVGEDVHKEIMANKPRTVLLRMLGGLMLGSVVVIPLFLFNIIHQVAEQRKLNPSHLTLLWVTSVILFVSMGFLGGLIFVSDWAQRVL